MGDGPGVACERPRSAWERGGVGGQVHADYDRRPFLVDDAALGNGRLTLVLAVRQVLRSGLALLGVSAPEQM